MVLIQEVAPAIIEHELFIDIQPRFVRVCSAPATGRAPLAVPRIQDLRAGRFEISNVAGNESHAMSQSGCSDERVSDRPRIWNMQSGATARDRRVDR